MHVPYDAVLFGFHLQENGKHYRKNATSTRTICKQMTINQVYIYEFCADKSLHIVLFYPFGYPIDNVCVSTNDIKGLDG